MARATEERTQNQPDDQPESKAGQPSNAQQNQGKQGKVFEYQQGKEITGEQHGTGAQQTQPSHKEQHQSPPGDAKR